MNIIRSVRSGIVGFILPLACVVNAAEFSGARPLETQPSAAQITNGLAINYFYEFFDHIDELENRSGGKKGEPLKNLSHRTIDGKVLTANRVMGVGCHIRGLIHLDSKGTYIFRIESNDGVKLKIGDIEMWKDPEIHGNRWSDKLHFVVEQSGWYSFWMNYYQRKGTSAIQLAWTPPGASEESIVPTEALALPLP